MNDTTGFPHPLPHCPECDRRIADETEIGALAAYVQEKHDDKGEVIGKTTTPYLLCNKCMPPGGSPPSVEQAARVEKRLDQKPGRYTLALPIEGLRYPLPATIMSGCTEPWQQDDRDWFAAHPSRSFRRRKVHPGEADGGAASGWVIICQIKPGYRARYSLPEYNPLIRDDDEALWPLFDEVSRR